MITFDRGNVRFNYRITGVVIVDGKVLLQRNAGEEVWFMPGGRAELGEPAEETLRREMREELGVDIVVERLLWVVENFFEIADTKFHELGLFFLMSFPGNASLVDTDRSILIKDSGYEFVFQWHSLDMLDDIVLVPWFLKTALKALPETIQHIVHIDS